MCDLTYSHALYCVDIIISYFGYSRRRSNMIASDSEDDYADYQGENVALGGADDIVVSPTAINIVLTPLRSQPAKSGKTCDKGIYAW